MNLPPAWKSRAGSGFDTFLCEGFQYGGIDFNLDKAQTCAGYPFTALSWDRAHCRYLMGWYYPAWPWAREFQAAQRTAFPLIKFWAYDHMCLFGWPLPLPKQPPAPVILLIRKTNEVLMDDRDARLQEVARIAVALEAQTGCPAQLMIAQWAVESQWGAKPAGHANYFGIKKAARHEMCCTVTTREVIHGESKMMDLEFADYPSLADSCEDYAWLITNR